MSVFCGVWFVIGAFVGSFLNVCIYRMPRGQSIVAPRSRCPQCEHPIAWYENIPLISYLILGGRCRHCRGTIHWRYPIVEAVSGLATVVIVQRFGVHPVGIIYLVFVWALIVVSLIDLEHRIIPDEISVYGRWIGLAVSFLIPVLHATG
ncbi:MAG: prepilin peptidase, partial [Candidatus Omnitrophica bacterium]|nr:prepilin peptidase [Candidatus Omnitrophota bacterium]